MSFASNIQSLATRIATEFKAIRTLIGGTGTSNISGLTTTDKSSLVGAINEVAGIAGSGGASTLDELTDVTLTAPVTGHLIRYNAGEWQNVLGTDYYEVAGAAAAAQGASQPVDSDLTAIAALSTTAYGRAFLTLANQAGLMSLLAASSATVQGIVELATNAEAQAGTDTVRAVTPAGLAAAITDAKNAILGAGVPAALDTLDELAAALGDDANFASTVTTNLAGKQPLDADLTSIAAQPSAADKMLYATGPQAWALTTLTAFARTLLDDADAATARGTLSVYSQLEIGDPNTDFVATFNAGLV